MKMEIIHTGAMILLFLIIGGIALKVQLGLNKNSQTKKGNRQNTENNP